MRPASRIRGTAAPPDPGGARRARSFRAAVACALHGVRVGVRRQPNLRAHIAIAGLVLLGGAAARLSGLELAVLAGAIGLVLSAELLNTSIELLTDLVSPGDDPRAGAVKDVSAGAVLVASGSAVALGVFVALPHVWPAAPIAGRAAAALGTACLIVFAIAARESPTAGDGGVSEP